VAVEGLPGSGKTTLVTELARVMPDIRIVPELAIKKPDEVSLSFYLQNDRAKLAMCQSSRQTVLDRAWPSTAAYVLAETRLVGDPAEPEAVIAQLYGTMPPCPHAYVFVDNSRALARTYAHDGHFGDLCFRHLLRAAYYDIFKCAAVPLLAVNSNTNPDIHPFTKMQLNHPGGGA
jgi:hypothetical protein